MKKTFKLIGIFALALLAGFTMASCDEDDEKNNGGEEKFSGKVITSNERGTSNGYDYEFWKNNNATGTMTLGKGGAFKCEWANTGSGGNILFRSGKRYDSTQSHSTFGTFSIKYKAEYTPASGISYLSVYGWTKNPLVEYYIVENYNGNYHPGTSGVKKGSFTVDGSVYDIYTRNMIQQPAVAGGGKYDFTQYISVRAQKRTSGTISVSEHFKKWHSLGMNMNGGFYEVTMKVEGYNSAGSAKLTENTLTRK